MDQQRQNKNVDQQKGKFSIVTVSSSFNSLSKAFTRENPLFGYDNYKLISPCSSTNSTPLTSPTKKK